MSYKGQQVIVMLMLTHFSYGSSSSLSKIDPPVLDVEGDILRIHSNTSFTVVCTGDLALRWSYPKSLKPPQVDIKEWNKKTRSSLTVVKAEYQHTGYYKCGYVTENITTQVYVFVTDPQHLFVNPAAYMVTQVKSNVPLIIPCRVTEPAAKVSLIKMDSNNRVMKLGEDITYDSKVGFRISFPNVHYSGLFHCKATLGARSEVSRHILWYIVATTYPPSPRIITVERGYMENTTFTLTCEVLVAYNTIVNVTWGYPHQKGITIVQPSRVTRKHVHSNGYDYDKIIAKITISLARGHHSGRYSCNAVDHSNMRKSHSVNINVWGRHTIN